MHIYTDIIQVKGEKTRMIRRDDVLTDEVTQVWKDLGILLSFKEMYSDHYFRSNPNSLNGMLWNCQNMWPQFCFQFKDDILSREDVELDKLSNARITFKVLLSLSSVHMFGKSKVKQAWKSSEDVTGEISNILMRKYLRKSKYLPFE